MPRPRSAPDLYLLTKVSSLYYLRDQTQQEIADRLRISRPTVSRLLQEAQQQGIVQITVAPPRGLHTELESRLEERFGLQEAQVVALEPRQARDLLKRQLGASAAGYLARTVQRGDSIGLSWGTTLSALVDAMTPLPTDGVRVVQTLGGIGPPDAASYAGSLVRRLAQLLGATPVLLPAPGVVPSAAVRDALRGDQHVQAALKQLDALDVVYVGIGALATNAALNDPASLPPGLLKELRRAGAIGDIALRFFDAAGESVRTSLDERLLGITRDQLRRARRVVAVAGGLEKVDAIAAALATGVISVLFTDQSTAEALASRPK
ncbi:sugar-binding domain-containing protein (plasmid) [Gemmatirosa kalamazoonensis]|uniref:Sugar-binding domain-containing protein n=1 Tax=Gemmatirosa kalamazoonensis TaxID=861299 RepID=W0RR77_9BACT|nr:sugar-binding transcriptional regulator [Gemmatirosa kalamazoonensis]AHG93181.1 sugar-binding domain-containing protein [Gemmatirosa kalamazoonensis]